RIFFDMWHLGDRSGGSEAQSLSSSTAWILPPPGGACQLSRRALRDSGIAVTALHSHMLADSPRPVSHALAESRTLWSQFRGERQQRATTGWLDRFASLCGLADRLA